MEGGYGTFAVFLLRDFSWNLSYILPPLWLSLFSVLNIENGWFAIFKKRSGYLCGFKNYFYFENITKFL